MLKRIDKEIWSVAAVEQSDVPDGLGPFTAPPLGLARTGWVKIMSEPKQAVRAMRRQGPRQYRPAGDAQPFCPFE